MESIKDLSMFDKVIEVTFHKTREEALYTGEVQSEASTYTVGSTISCPRTGIKPAISISGQFNNKSEANNIVLQITNFYADTLLTNYSFVSIVAGYMNGVKTQITGYILHCYPESAPPDGVMTFEILIGDIELYYNTVYTANYLINTPLETIFSDLAFMMDLELVYNFDKTKVGKTFTPAPISLLTTVRECVLKLKEMYPGLVVKFDTKKLYVTDRYSSYGVIHDLKYIKFAKKDASGFVIDALWSPVVMPLDFVRADPVYYKQSFGGQNISGNIFRVITVDFAFSTIGTDNNMSVLLTEFT